MKYDCDMFKPVNSNDKYTPPCYCVILVFIFIDEKLKLCHTNIKAFMISTIIGKYQNNKFKCTESKTKRYLHKSNHIKYITHILIEIRIQVYIVHVI